MTCKRRTFIKTATAAMLLPVDEILAATPERLPGKPGFSLTFKATDWGFQGDVRAFCQAAREAGYDGVEVWWPTDEHLRQRLFSALKDHQLAVGFLCGGNGPDPEAHLEAFKKQIDQVSAHSGQRPLYINCHSGAYSQ